MAANEPERQCSRCKGGMIPGIIVDTNQASRSQSTWAPGQPEPSFWRGGLKIDDDDRLPITTFRCRACGFLESFAFPPPLGDPAG